MNAIVVNGVKLSMEESGNGPSVIPVHGIPQDYRTWKDLSCRLSKDFHVINYSRRCTLPNLCRDYEGSTIENNVKDLEELIAMIGSGLGLYLVKSLVDSYGGRVWLEDRVKRDHRKGARFVVMLPAIEKWLLFSYFYK